MGAVMDVRYHSSSVIGAREVRAKMRGGIVRIPAAEHGAVQIVSSGIPNKGYWFYGLEPELTELPTPLTAADTWHGIGVNMRSVEAAAEAVSAAPTVHRKRLPKRSTNAFTETPAGTVHLMLKEAKESETRRAASRAREIEDLMSIFEDDEELSDT